MKVFADVSTGQFDDIFIAEILSEMLEEPLTEITKDIFAGLGKEASLPAEVHVSLSLVEEGRMRDLNRDFLGEDSATDVLSFPLHADEKGFAISPGVPLLLLGDIVVCPTVVGINAETSGHSFEREFSLVILHGLLHLFGMDHDTEERKNQMWLLQDLYWDKIEQSLPPKMKRNGNSS